MWRSHKATMRSVDTEEGTRFSYWDGGLWLCFSSFTANLQSESHRCKIAWLLAFVQKARGIKRRLHGGRMLKSSFLTHKLNDMPDVGGIMLWQWWGVKLMQQNTKGSGEKPALMMGEGCFSSRKTTCRFIAAQDCLPKHNTQLTKSQSRQNLFKNLKTAVQ